MRYVKIYELERILKYATFLQARPDLGACVTSLRVRTKYAWQTDVEPRYRLALDQAFRSMPQLRFILTNLRHSGPLIRDLPVLFQNTLTFLSLHLHPEIEVALVSISQLKNLRAAALHMFSGLGAIGSPPPFLLPHVHSFFVEMPEDARPGLWSWLAGSRFRHDCALYLDAPPDLHSEVWLNMNPFFDAHACRHIGVAAWDTDNFFGPDSHILLQAKSVEFGRSIIPDAALFSRSRLPADIWLSMNPSKDEQVECTKNIIRVLSTTAHIHDLKLHLRIWPSQAWPRARKLLPVCNGTEEDSLNQVFFYIKSHWDDLRERGIDMQFDYPRRPAREFEDRECMYVGAT
jgi:hypothetical protein